MLNLELAHVSTRGKSAEPSIQATHTSNRQNSTRAEIMAAASDGSSADQIESSQLNAAKEAGSKLVMSAPIYLRGDGVLTERQRLAPEIASGLFEALTSTRMEAMGVCLSISRIDHRSARRHIGKRASIIGGTILRFTPPAVSRGKANAA